MILMYHNILDRHRAVDREYSGVGLPLQYFEQQLNWLLRYREVVALNDYLKMKEHGNPAFRNLVALTFDDGLASTFDRVYPLLRKQSVPSTFFISTSHLQPRKLLWFSYLNALCFESANPRIEVRGSSFELSSREQRRRARRSLGALAHASSNPKALIEELVAVYPLPDAIAAEYEGMSPAQLSLFGKSDLLECGAHTVNHPFLDQLSKEEQEEEIVTSKAQLAALTGRDVRYFAYPNGDYNCDTLTLLKQEGFDAAFATHRKRLGIDKHFEIERMGIYSTSFFKFWLKAQGVVKVAHRFGLSS
jgi:peptidoglycan/xylan/chitin deacetylase (PgdA/CDA1 family)